MLEPWIIEQIRRREEEERRRNERPQLEIPTHDSPAEHWRRQNEELDRKNPDRGRRPEDDRESDKKDEEKPERGVMIIDFGLG